jgi:hypothetical protein
MRPQAEGKDEYYGAGREFIIKGRSIAGPWQDLAKEHQHHHHQQQKQQQG